MSIEHEFCKFFFDVSTFLKFSYLHQPVHALSARSARRGAIQMLFVACWRSHPRELARPECGACKGGRQWLHTVHALSARFRKTRCHTNVVCCGLEIPPWRASLAQVWCVQGRTPVVT